MVPYLLGSSMQRQDKNPMTWARNLRKAGLAGRDLKGSRSLVFICYPLFNFNFYALAAQCVSPSWPPECIKVGSRFYGSFYLRLASDRHRPSENRYISELKLQEVKIEPYLQYVHLMHFIPQTLKKTKKAKPRNLRVRGAGMEYCSGMPDLSCLLGIAYFFLSYLMGTLFASSAYSLISLLTVCFSFEAYSCYGYLLAKLLGRETCKCPF